MPRSVSQRRTGRPRAPVAFWVKASRSAELAVGDHQRAADHVGVPAQVLGGRVHHHVGAQRRAAAAGTGDANVLSTTSSAPAVVRQPRPGRAMSAMLSSGFVGVSTQTTRGLPGGELPRTARPGREIGTTR